MSRDSGVSDNIKNFMIFAAPATFIFFTVMIVPFLYGLFLTFTNWDGISSGFSFIGFTNYINVITDGEFWMSFFITVKYVFISTIIINAIGFFLAYILSREIAGQNILRTGFFIPNLVGGILAGFIWRFFFSNALVFLGETLKLDMFSTSWLGDPNRAFWAMVVVTVWQYSGYMMIIYIAGFMTIPKELLEAASIDGANGAIRMKNIVLPFMVPSFIVCTFLSLQRCFMVYDVNLALTEGGPYRSTELISMHVYQRAFLSQDYGGGQAEALFLFLMISIITVSQVYFTKKLEIEA